jgi:hypothetical protein
MDGASFHVVVKVGVSKAPMLCYLEERRLMPTSPLDAVRYSSAESSIMTCYRVDAPL